MFSEAIGGRRLSSLADQTIDGTAETLKPLKLPPLPKNPLVSVLMANFNYGHFIGQAIESVLAQSYERFELIVCDDGSTDTSCQAILSYATRDPRIRLLRQPNSGQAAALNSAYRESTGEIICLLDADDRYLPEKLETVVRAFGTHPDGGFLAHRILRMDKEGRSGEVVSILWDPPSGWFGDEVLRSGDERPGLGPTSALCLRKDVANLIWPLPTSFTRDADAVIRCLAILITRVVGIPLPLAEYRFHGANITASSGITVESLDKGLGAIRSLWQIQHEFIEQTHPDFAEAFPAVERRFAFHLMTYQRGRLTKGRDALSAYRNLVRSSMFASYPLAVRWFWRASILLPRPAFQKALDAFWAWGGHGPLLRLCLRLIRLGRDGKTCAPGLLRPAEDRTAQDARIPTYAAPR